MALSEELKIFLQSMETRINENISGLRGEVSGYNRELKTCKKKCSKLESENKELKMEVSLLKKEINKITNKEKERNIMLFNIQDDEEFNDDILNNLSILLKSCEIEISNDAMVRAERRGKGMNKRPICLELKEVEYKKLFFNKAEQLKEKKILRP